MVYAKRARFRENVNQASDATIEQSGEILPDSAKVRESGAEAGKSDRLKVANPSATYISVSAEYVRQVYDKQKLSVPRASSLTDDLPFWDIIQKMWVDEQDRKCYLLSSGG